MNILDAIFKEMNYEKKESFDFKFGEDETYVVVPFISNEFSSQVFLVVEVQYSNIGIGRNSQFLSNLADAFCQQDIHSNEMDRNTSLLIKSLKTKIIEPGEGQLQEEKIKIEDDPYYFKKYVFSYTADEERAADEFFSKIAENGEVSYISEIQKYLAEATKFLTYKRNTKKDLLYSYFVELVTKVATFPLKVVCSAEMINIERLLEENLKQISDDDERQGMDKLLNLQIDFREDDIDEILNKCNECFKIN